MHSRKQWTLNGLFATLSFSPVNASTRDFQTAGPAQVGSVGFCEHVLTAYHFGAFSCQSNEMDFLDTSISQAEKEGAAASCHLNLHFRIMILPLPPLHCHGLSVAPGEWMSKPV